jgi:hypothetical protein
MQVHMTSDELKTLENEPGTREVDPEALFSSARKGQFADTSSLPV